MAAYLAFFLTSTASATDPAASAARIMFEDAKVLTDVASQLRQSPSENGSPNALFRRFRPAILDDDMAPSGG